MNPEETNSSPKKSVHENLAEKFGNHFETVRLWMTQSWRIGMKMVKGAYLTSERRRLFGKLGEDVFFRFQKGEFQNPELEPMVQELERLTKKLEHEELQIRSARFGDNWRRETKLDKSLEAETTDA